MSVSRKPATQREGKMLTSGISKHYRKPFFLDEDSLRRIHASLEKAAKDLQDPTTLIFHVERDDDRYYETANLDEVLSDSNVRDKKINFLGLGLRYIDEPKDTSWRPHWIVQVNFLKGRQSALRNLDLVEIKIGTENKSWALLLADELQSQIERTFKVKGTPRWLLVLCTIPLLVMGIRLNSHFLEISSNDSSADANNFVVFAIGFLAGVIIPLYIKRFDDDLGKWFIRFFGPETAFAWGDEARSYLEREQVRQNILWGVIVALLISIIASVVFAVLWSPSSF